MTQNDFEIIQSDDEVSSWFDLPFDHKSMNFLSKIIEILMKF